MSPVPVPLPSDLRLLELVRVAAGAGPVLGVWVRGRRGGAPPTALHASGLVLLLASDLGWLLHRCARVAVRQRGRIAVLDAGTLIAWRTLQIVTATPHLPDLTALRTLLPECTAGPGGIRVPLARRSAEEVLAACLAAGVAVAESRIRYHPAAH